MKELQSQSDFSYFCLKKKNMGLFDKRFMDRAIAIANESVSSNEGGPFGAIVVKNGKIIAEANNSVTFDNDPTAHAEVNAIRKACKKLDTFQLDGCDIYSSCEPCPMCLGAIYWSRAEHVFFAATKNDAAKAGFDDSFIYKEINMESAKRSIPFEHVEVKESNSPFENWANITKKIEY